jgi:translocator protein
MVKIVKLIISIFLCQSAGFIGSIFTRTSVETWYLTLNKPFFTPPSWLFAPVWIGLYSLMGIALFIIWNKDLDNKLKNRALSVFLLQLLFNAAWPIVFFGIKNIALSVIVIILLWLLILATILIFYRVSKTASLLLIPYILWVSFAALLNLAILILNI